MKKRTQQMSIAFGFFMAFLMVASLILPALAPNQNTSPTVPPAPTSTTVPVPTFPPPITDFSGISFGEQYLHPSGLFSIGVPTGWTPNAPINNSSQAQVNLSNPDVVSVIETYIVNATSEQMTPDEVSAFFNETALRSSWSQYTSWQELSRRTDENRVLIDFELARGQQQFLARHAAWADASWIYVVRVVVPQNARELLFWLLDQMIANFTSYERFAGTPLGWAAYYDTEDLHIIRRPQDWQLVDGGAGQPTSFIGSDGTQLRVEALDGIIASEDEASAWVEGLRSTNTVQSVMPVTREGGSGFEIAFSYSTPDGDARSGKVVLLNGEDDQLHAATLLLPSNGVDLNSEEGRTQYVDATQVMDTFSLLQNLNLLSPEPVVTPTPEFTSTPEAEVTAEVTPEAEATDEPTEEPVEEATPEATAEPEATEESEG